jgi:hypothetical protein
MSNEKLITIEKLKDNNTLYNNTKNKKSADKSALTEDEKILKDKLIKDFSDYFSELYNSEMSFDGKEYANLKKLYHEYSDLKN